MSRLRNNFFGGLGYSFGVKDGPLLGMAGGIRLLEKVFNPPVAAAGMALNFEKGEKFPGKARHGLPEQERFIMNGSKFRFNDHRELFHPASRTESARPPRGLTMAGARSARPAEEALPPAPGEHHRHCTAGEIAQELGYSVSYILAVKKAMYPHEAARPRRLDPAEVSEWIYAHPSFRMREVYEHHPKDGERGQRLLEI